MGFQISKEGLNHFFKSLKNDYDIYAPIVFEGGGIFSDTDCIRYAKINSIEEIEFEKNLTILLRRVFYLLLKDYFILQKKVLRKQMIKRKVV